MKLELVAILILLMPNCIEFILVVTIIICNNIKERIVVSELNIYVPFLILINSLTCIFSTLLNTPDSTIY